MTEPAGPVRVCLFGLGAIGTAVARAVLSSPDLELCCAIDKDRAKVGRDVRSVLRLRGTSGVVVSDDPAGALRQTRPDVVIHCTGSFLREVAPQLEIIIDAGIPCVTSCEEASFPETVDADLTTRLAQRAAAKGVALLGAGVNPGFVMDALALALSGAARDVNHIAVERVFDPLTRRRAFRKKVGLGLTFAQASRQVEQGRLGHVGLKQSALLVARGMGWEVSRVSEQIRVLTEDDVAPKRSRRAPRHDGAAIGLEQTLVASGRHKEIIRMEMVMAAGVEGPHDAITIQGEPDLKLWIQGGVPGDQATISCLVNGMYHVLAGPRPGFLTMLDLPLRPVRAPARRD